MFFTQQTNASGHLPVRLWYKWHYSNCSIYGPLWLTTILPHFQGLLICSSLIPNHQNHPQFAPDWTSVEICQTSSDSGPWAGAERWALSGRRDARSVDHSSFLQVDICVLPLSPSQPEASHYIFISVYCIRGHGAIVVGRTPSDYLEQPSVPEISQWRVKVYASIPHVTQNKDILNSSLS